MASTYNGVVSNERWENLRRPAEDDEINVGRTERVISGVAAAAVAVVGLRRKRLRPFLLPVAGSLFSRAVTGRCSINRALGRNSARKGRVSPVTSVPRGEGIKVERSVVVNRPVQEVYQFWRNFENLPRFMDHLESVTVLDESRSHWVAKAPAGTRVEWDATIHNEMENQLIAWRSLPKADVNNAGSVHFTPSADGGTEVRVILSYEPPGGKLGAAVAKLLGEEPSKQVDDDLRRFKQVMEAAVLHELMSTNSPRLTYDCVIVGAGPAGLSAALMLGRCRRRALVCDIGEPRNVRSVGLHNYLTRDGILPAEFLQHAREDVARYPTVEFRQVEVLDAAASPDGFRLVCADGRQIATRKLLLATGVVDELPELEGLQSLYGISVHHCPYCDGWEWQEQPIAVHGSGEEGKALALGLTVWSRDLVLCTNGPSGLSEEDQEQLSKEGIEIREERLARLEGTEGKLERIVFETGESLARKALFICAGQHQRSALARKLGCRFTSKGAVDTGTCEATDVPGLYVAGDASKEAQFVIVAAAEGSEAGMAINKALLKEDLAQNKNSTPSRTRRGGPYVKSG